MISAVKTIKERFLMLFILFHNNCYLVLQSFALSGHLVLSGHR